MLMKHIPEITDTIVATTPAEDST